MGMLMQWMKGTGRGAPVPVDDQGNGLPATLRNSSGTEISFDESIEATGSPFSFSGNGSALEIDVSGYAEAEYYFSSIAGSSIVPQITIATDKSGYTQPRMVTMSLNEQPRTAFGQGTQYIVDLKGAKWLKVVVSNWTSGNITGTLRLKRQLSRIKSVEEFTGNRQSALTTGLTLSTSARLLKGMYHSGVGTVSSTVTFYDSVSNDVSGTPIIGPISTDAIVAVWHDFGGLILTNGLTIKITGTTTPIVTAVYR